GSTKYQGQSPAVPKGWAGNGPAASLSRLHDSDSLESRRRSASHQGHFRPNAGSLVFSQSLGISRRAIISPHFQPVNLNCSEITNRHAVGMDDNQGRLRYTSGPNWELTWHFNVWW